MERKPKNVNPFPQQSYISPLLIPGSNKMIYDLTPQPHHQTMILDEDAQPDHITIERARLERHLRKISQELSEMKMSQQHNKG
jgi:hypothetical protein